MAITQTPQTPQTPQTLPTSKVGQAFHALKAGLGLYIIDEREKFSSGYYDKNLKRCEKAYQVRYVLDSMTIYHGDLPSFLDTMVKEFGLECHEEMNLREGVMYVVRACLAEYAMKQAFALGMTRQEKCKFLVGMAKDEKKAQRWAERFLCAEVEKVTFSTADARSWL